MKYKVTQSGKLRLTLSEEESTHLIQGLLWTDADDEDLDTRLYEELTAAHVEAFGNYYLSTLVRRRGGE